MELAIPKESIGKRVGFSIDIGGSAIKTVVLSPLNQDEDRLDFRTFPVSELDQALLYLKEKCGGATPQGATVATTGVGCHQQMEKINMVLGVKIKNVSEIVCFVKAFHFLTKHLPREMILHPPNQTAEQYNDRMVCQLKETFAKVQALYGLRKTEETATPPYKAGAEPCKANAESSSPQTEEERAYFLVTIGSGVAVNKVDPDGSYKTVDEVTRAGRMFLSLGSLLTGVSDFQGLISLAEKGNSDVVNVTAKDLKTGSDTDVYNMMPDDMPLYSFGNAFGKKISDFRPEDLARALLSSICADIGQNLHLMCLAYDVQQIYITGSFPSESELVRQELSASLLYRTQARKCLGRTTGQMQFQFVKYGSYLGALGALLQS